MSDLKELIFVENYSPSVKELLYSQFSEERSPNLHKVIDAFSKPLDEVEAVAKQIYTQLDIDVAIGEQLDGLGQIIVLPRNGLNDDDYRAALKFKIKLNRSYGQPELLISALRFFTNSTIVELFESFPAAMFAFVNGTEGLDHLTQKMKRLSLGGVNFIYISNVDSDAPFAFDSEGQEDYGLGYAWYTGTEVNGEGAGEYAWALPN